MTEAAIGIDVGTGSARAGVFDLAGNRLGKGEAPIRIWRPAPDFVEQSSDDIWQAVCRAVAQAMAEAGPGLRITGIGFDATCSLVALDAAGRPVSVSPTGQTAQNVIVWMDHRALAEARRINDTGQSALRYVGGRISPEMETPKLLWLKERMPDAWAKVAHFFDLPDFLTWRATGAFSRSLCSTVCKWAYVGHEGRWDADYFQAIGLGDLVEEGFARIGTEVLALGMPVGAGLSPVAAAELGLPAGTPVATSVIDAHAGGLGVIGAVIEGEVPDTPALERRLALIGGTSSCHMAVSAAPRFVDGVWGPYFSAMVPGLWLNEGGQSATGALVDHVIAGHGAAAVAAAGAATRGITVYELLNAHLAELAVGQAVPGAMTADLHVLPYFHGNRSPRADASLRGMVSGLRLASGLDDLALLYLATIQGVAHGTKHIIDTLNGAGGGVDTILACGGGTRNPVFLREHADATGCRIVLPRELEAVLLGSALLGAVAGDAYPNVTAAMAAMTRAGAVVEPAANARRFHAAKHAVFLRMYEDQMAYRALMKEV